MVNVRVVELIQQIIKMHVELKRYLMVKNVCFVEMEHILILMRENVHSVLINAHTVQMV